MEFHLIDLVSQGTAVEDILRGKSKNEWIDWLAKHGEITKMERTDPSWPETYFFKSKTGIECAFVLGKDELLFAGDHHFFKSKKAD